MKPGKTHGLWLETACPAPITDALNSHRSADVVIIGGGFTGCSAALHLAELGKKAIILEATDIGFGAAGRNVGLVNAGLWVRPTEVYRRLGPIHSPRLLRLLGTAPGLVFDIIARYKLSCEGNANGTLHCAVGRRGLDEITERYRQWVRLGANVNLLDQAEATSAIGSTRFTGALLDKRAGTVQPLGYVRGLAGAAIKAGAEVYTSTPAIGITNRITGWEVATPNGMVSTQAIIVAGDAYATGPFRAVKEEQVLLPYFNLATAPIPTEIQNTILPGRHGAWDTKTVLTSFRFDQSGRLVIGSIGKLTRSGHAVHREWVRRYIQRLFPQIAHIDLTHAWSGNIGMTNDSMPRLHVLDRNLFSVSGYNGRGIAPGTAFGRELARLCAGETSIENFPLPVTEISREKFRTIKSVTYDLGAIMYHFIDSRS